MSVSAALVILMVGTTAEDPSSPTLEAAAKELLGQSATVRIEVTPEDLSDAETLARAGTADGVIELSWSDDRSSALLHCYISGDGRWVDRRITFSAADQEPDRGRLLGFAIASMFPRLASTTGRAAASPPTAEPPGDRRLPREHAPIRGGVEVDVVALGSLGVRGPADAWGAAAGIRGPLTRALSLRATIGGRLGELSAASVSTQAAAFGVGIAWDATPGSPALEVGARADLLATWTRFERERDDGRGTERQSRWLFGGAVMAEGVYFPSRFLGIQVAVGSEALLGSTDIYAHGELQQKLPVFRVVGELGVRARF